MFNRYLTYYSPALQFVIFCAIMSMSLFIGAHLNELLSVRYLGISADTLGNLKEISPELAFKFKLLNSVLLIVILFLPACLFAYLAYPKPLVYVGLHSGPGFRQIVFAFLLFLAAIPFVYLLEEWSRSIPFFNPEADQYGVLAKAMLKGNAYRDLFINTLCICLIPALTEEIFFRGCLQQILLNWMRKAPYIALLIVAVLFSAYHAQLSGFIPRVFLGFLLGLVYYYSGSLWLAIGIHFLNNFMSVLFAFLFQRGVIHTDLNELDQVNPVFGLAGLAGLVVIVYFFNRSKIPFRAIEVEKEMINDEPPHAGV